MSLTDMAKILGKPYFQAPNCLIYKMDCLEAMKLLPDRFVDLTVTSPPYKRYLNCPRAGDRLRSIAGHSRSHCSDRSTRWDNIPIP